MGKEGVLRTSTVALVACLAWLALPGPAARSHEIPPDVTIQIIVKPVGDRLELLARVPLEAMRDIEFPTVGPGYLDIGTADTALRDAANLWLADSITIFEQERQLPRPRLVAVRASIPSDRSFADYEMALAHIRGTPLPSTTQLVWQQALLDVQFELPIGSDESRFSIRSGLERLGLRVTTAIRFIAPDGRERAYELEGTARKLTLDPRWHQAAFDFVRRGFTHILDGHDHLLFLLCLVLPFYRSYRELVWIVTAFTLAHSVTLIASAYGLAPGGLWFPPLVETLIAASIFYMALENVVAPNVRMRWTLAFAFGLVHGFGFSFALRETLQFAGDHVLLSLLSFNIGVELGQLLVLAILLPVLGLAMRFLVRERVAILVVSVLIAHTAWHWLGERWDVLSAFWTV